MSMAGRSGSLYAFISFVKFDHLHDFIQIVELQYEWILVFLCMNNWKFYLHYCYCFNIMNIYNVTIPKLSKQD